MKTSTKIRLLLGFIFTLATVYIGYNLYELYEQEQLWGQRVLWFWTSFWIAFLCFTAPFISNLAQSNQLLLASSASGLLLAAGFMPMPTFFLMFIAFVPLLWVERVITKTGNKNTKWTVFKYAFNSFFIWNILSTWWIQNSSFFAGFAGNTLNAIFMCIPFLFYHITNKRMTTRAANLGFVSFWMTFEIGHLYWDLSWPWLTLGNSFAHFPSLIQWYEFTGVFGGSLWILVMNSWIANLLFDYYDKSDDSTPNKKANIGLLLKPSLGFLIPIFISLAIYFMHDVKSKKSAEVVTVQPNYEPHYQKFKTSQEQQFAHFAALSKEKLTANTAYLVFPETSFGSIPADQLNENYLIQKAKFLIKNYAPLNLVLGINSYLLYEEGAPKPEHLYKYCNKSGTNCQYIDSHNAAIQLNNSSDEIPYYKKSKLVPGAESMPYIGNIKLFQNLILNLGGVPGVSLGTQKERAVFKSKQGIVAPLICYESIYGDYVTEYTQLGAEAFFVITNDGWWDNSWGHRQHLYLSSLRAIENRRYLVRSANTGISCFINSRGDIYNASKYNEAIAIRDTIYLRTDRTFYSRYGDLIGRVSILITCWLLVSMLSNGLRPKIE